MSMNKTEIRKLKKESLVIMVFENQGLKETIKNLQDGNKELVIQNSQLNNEHVYNMFDPPYDKVEDNLILM